MTPPTLSSTVSNPRGAALPLAPQQQPLWLLDRLAPGNPAGNIAVRWKLEGPLDSELLKRAIDLIIRRHETLRTRFETVAGEPVQIVEPHSQFDLGIVDLRHLATPQREPEIERRSSVEARTGFDLTRAPLLRASLLRIGDEEYWLLVTIHHLVSDGWSIGTLADEITVAYAAFERGEEPSLPELPLQYRDYVRAETEQVRRNVSKPQLLYWLRKLKDLPRFEVPADKPRPPIMTANSEIVSVLLPAILTDALANFSRRNGATLYMTALTALTALLSRRTGATTIVLGTPVTGRNSVKFEPMIGLFRTVVVLRCDLSGDPTFLELLGRTRQTVLEALASQDVSFERLVELLKPPRDLSRNQLAQVSFIFQRSFIPDRNFGRMRLIDVPSKSAGALYDLNFFMVERPDGWRASCELNTDLYEPETVQGMLAEFRALLEQIAAKPDCRISGMPWDRAIPEKPALPRDEETARVQAIEGAESARFADPPAALADAPAIGISKFQTRLLAIWEEVLHVSPLSATDDFFAVGGDSLRAAKLMARISETFGRKIPLALIFRFSTPEKLAAELAQQTASDEPLRLLELDEGDQPPFFMVNAFTGLVEVAKRLDSGHPILSLIGDDAKALSGSYDLFEEAGEHVRTILTRRPRGPYLIGGWSAGGVMAFEIAQSLKALGREVALLVLFDAPNPFFMREYSRVEHFRIWIRESFAYHRANLHTMDLSQAPGYLLGRLARAISNRFKRQDQSKLLEAFEVRIRTARKYRPLPYAGRVVLFKRDRHLSGRYLDPMFGWGGVVQGDFEVCTIETSHLDIFAKENQRFIARKLGVRLTEAVAEVTRPSRS